jgi:peptidoglycan hydrolase CwlO-like protein
VAALVAALLIGLVMGGPVRADTKSDLDKTKAELAAANSALSALLNQIADETATKDDLQNQANDIASQIDKVQSRIAKTQGRIVQKELEIRVAGAQLDGTQVQLDRRARLAFESGGSNLDFLLGSTSLADLADRLEIVNHAAASDKELIDEYNTQRAVMEIKQRDLQDLESTQQADQADLTKQQNALGKKLQEANATLTKLEADKADAASLTSSLSGKVADLARKYAAELKAIEDAKKAKEGSVSGVLLTCPVKGSHAYSDDFGAPRYGGGYHLHAGNDIFAALGTPIVATFPGTVEQDGNDLGGLAVKVFGAAGWTYNAHLSAYEGSYPRSVNTGDVIGYVGNSGDAQGGAFHDHFEWHPNVIPAHPHVSPYGVSVVGDAIDPWPYLNGAGC